MCRHPCGDVQAAMWWVAHVIFVSAQVLLILTLGLWTLDFGTSDLGLTINAVAGNILEISRTLKLRFIAVYDMRQLNVAGQLA